MRWKKSWWNQRKTGATRTHAEPDHCTNRHVETLTEPDRRQAGTTGLTTEMPRTVLSLPFGRGSLYVVPPHHLETQEMKLV
jgi:hypothetical protein